MANKKMETVESIAKANFGSALDYDPSIYSTKDEQIEAYAQNAVDTAREHGLDAQAVHYEFWKLVEEDEF